MSDWYLVAIDLVFSIKAVPWCIQQHGGVMIWIFIDTKALHLVRHCSECPTGFSCKPRISKWYVCYWWLYIPKVNFHFKGPSTSLKLTSVMKAIRLYRRDVSMHLRRWPTARKVPFGKRPMAAGAIKFDKMTTMASFRISIHRVIVFVLDFY